MVTHLTGQRKPIALPTGPQEEYTTSSCRLARRIIFYEKSI